jgi:hypothetical protein
MERLRACGAAGLRQGEIHNRGRRCTGDLVLYCNYKYEVNQRLRAELVLSGVWSASALVSRLADDQALASLDVQRGQLEAVGAGLAGLAGARCGRLRDGRGVRDGLTSRVTAMASYLVILPSSAGILDSCIFFAVNSTRYCSSDQMMRCHILLQKTVRSMK